MSESAANTTSFRNEHDAVVRHLREVNKVRFKVLDNLEGDKNHVAGLFPDLILQDASGNLLFIIEVKRKRFM